MKTKQKGLLSEQVVICELLRRDYTVLTTIGDNARYDLVLDYKGTLLKVQVKTGRLRNGAIVFQTRSTQSNRRKRYSSYYSGQINLFMLYCPETEQVYFCPIELAGSEGRLRVDEAQSCNQFGRKWAHDFTLDKLDAWLERIGT